MRSIKPGRGPSAMGAMGSIIAIIFGIFWTFMAVKMTKMGAPIIFPLFGVLFIIIGIAQAVYNFKNAAGKNRFSAFDITDANEEADPLEQLVRKNSQNRSESDSAFSTSGISTVDNITDVNFCPYCGTPVEDAFSFCQKCGKPLP